MGIKIAESSDHELANLNTLTPGDTFETEENDLYLVTNNRNEDEEMQWDVVKLVSGEITSMEDIEVVRLANLTVIRNI